jgi:hypothetical protein
MSCGIRAADSKVVCWGSGGESLMLGAPNTREYLDVDGNCRIRAQDNILECDESTNFTQGIRATSVSSSRSMCAITIQGGVYCKGYNEFGQVSAHPQDTGWIEVTTGEYFACARRDTGEVSCWGRNDANQLTSRVDGVDAMRNPGEGALSAGDQFGCALVGPDNHPSCWGSDENAIKTTPEVEMRMVSASAPSGFLGTDWVCGLTQADDTPVCWGKPDYITSTPTQTAFDTIDVGPRSACGVRADDGKIECWGASGGIQPDLPDELAFTDVSVGESVCVLSATTRTVHCVGGQLWNPVW